ncbi:hypothetical protein FHG87_002900 [Trinorchestia longiramus]|nr:hypothetical protein FHG87_002900 [Trinorchestia longiramus]
MRVLGGDVDFGSAWWRVRDAERCSLVIQGVPKKRNPIFKGALENWVSFFLNTLYRALGWALLTKRDRLLVNVVLLVETRPSLVAGFSSSVLFAHWSMTTSLVAIMQPDPSLKANRHTKPDSNNKTKYCKGSKARFSQQFFNIKGCDMDERRFCYASNHTKSKNFTYNRHYLQTSWR